MKGKSITRCISRAGMKLKRNSPTILTCLGVIGVISTVVMSVKATAETMNALEEASEKKGEELNAVEIVKIAAPIYIPTILTGMATITCIVGANSINKKKNAALSSAYCMASNSFNEYRRKLIELHGKEADIEIRDALARERCDYHVIDLDVPDQKVIFYDEMSGQSILRYEREIIDAEYHFNRNYVLRGYAAINEFYEFLGMPQQDWGDEIGWSCSDGIYWIDFEHRLIDRDDGGIPIYSIDMVFPPDNDYLREWE